jgi:hypothetical protein
MVFVLFYMNTENNNNMVKEKRQNPSRSVSESSKDLNVIILSGMQLQLFVMVAGNNSTE